MVTACPLGTWIFHRSAKGKSIGADHARIPPAAMKQVISKKAGEADTKHAVLLQGRHPKRQAGLYSTPGTHTRWRREARSLGLYSRTCAHRSGSGMPFDPADVRTLFDHGVSRYGLFLL